MNVQEKVCFVSKKRYLSVQKYPGFTVQKAVPGGTTAVNEPAEFVKFKDHRILTNSTDIIEFLRKVSKEKPELGIREIREKTKKELYVDEMAKLKEQMDRVKKMKGELAPTEEEKEAQEEKIVEEVEEVTGRKMYTAPCADCDWVASSSVSQAHANNKLRGHRAAKHKKI